MEKSAPHHLRALAQANRVRLARAALKRRLAAAELDVAEVVAATPQEAAGMALGELLMSQRGWGRARCRRLLGPLGLAERKALRTLTERQRRLLLGALAARRPAGAELVAQSRSR